MMVGKRVECIQIDDADIDIKIPAGTQGTIVMVDANHILHINWDNGEEQFLIPGEDEFKFIRS